MKKITLTIFAFGASLGLFAQQLVTNNGTASEGTFSGEVITASEMNRGASITLVQNTDNVITGTNSVACQGGDNFHGRQFLLADFGVTGDFEITTGEIGVQSIDASGTDVTVNVYSSDGLFPASFPAGATLLGSQIVNIPGGSDLGIIEFPFDTPVVIPAGTEEVVVEVFQELNGVSFFIGGTADEFADSYLKSDQCATPAYVTTTDIGFPDAHYYITVTGEEVLGVGENALSQVSVYPNPATDIVNIKAPAYVEIQGAVMYDILGKQVSNNISNGQIDISNLSRGVYMLNVQTSAGTLTQKVVKK